jgi:hypothetical protein
MPLATGFACDVFVRLPLFVNEGAFAWPSLTVPDAMPLFVVGCATLRHVGKTDLHNSSENQPGRYFSSGVPSGLYTSQGSLPPTSVS